MPAKLSSKLSPYEIYILNKFISYIGEKSFLDKLVLFGSRSLSEGYSNEESDMDIAVIVADKNDIKNMEELIENWINKSDITGFLFHPLVVDKKTYKKIPLGKSIDRGDILWNRKTYSR